MKAHGKIIMHYSRLPSLSTIIFNFGNTWHYSSLLVDLMMSVKLPVFRHTGDYVTVEKHSTNHYSKTSRNAVVLHLFVINVSCENIIAFWNIFNFFLA